jgi:hypothetical protein
MKTTTTKRNAPEKTEHGFLFKTVDTVLASLACFQDAKVFNRIDNFWIDY